MENMITLALKAKATIKPFEDDSAIIFNEAQLNHFLNMVALETTIDRAEYKTIKQEIYHYTDLETGARVYDTETIMDEFIDKLNQLTGEPTL
jgi:hypothetical protein